MDFRQNKGNLKKRIKLITKKTKISNYQKTHLTFDQMILNRNIVNRIK